jgi:hypothetical protein
MAPVNTGITGTTALLDQILGFGLYLIRADLSKRGDEMIGLSNNNLMPHKATNLGG